MRKLNSEWVKAPRIVRVSVSARIDPAVKEACEKAAKTEHRSFSSFVESALIERCSKHGLDIVQTSNVVGT